MLEDGDSSWGEKRKIVVVYGGKEEDGGSLWGEK
jgi:hypothetical protein